MESETPDISPVANAVAPVAAPPAPAVQVLPAVPVFDPRRRMRELLAIPDRDRTDAEWDELNELEIQTAPGNRATGSGQPSVPYAGRQGYPAKNNRPKGVKGPHKPQGGGGRPQQQGKPGGGQQGGQQKPPRPA